MNSIFRRLTVLLCLLIPSALMAQQTAWVQIEARPSLIEAQSRARFYAAQLPQVNGFSLGSGWYAIALGPYDEAGAKSVLGRLRTAGQIPHDSFVADGRAFGQRFWPIGARPPAPAAQAPVATQETTVTPPPDETPAQARASEAQLPREARQNLQRALEWEGFYTAAIDGDFGPGTRRAMAAYQQANGSEPTGILTTKERGQLIAGYQSALSELGMQTVVDEKAGISVDMPTAMVAFDSYDYPFAHYKGRGDSQVQVILISQRGTKATLSGLYDVLETLAIVPRTGTRDKKRRSFVLTGADNKIASYTYAALDDGQIKGFTLVWPAGDDKRMNRVISQMRTSFTALPRGVLDETMRLGGADQNIDLMSGLELRKPATTHSGFFVDAAGTVVTSSDALGACRQITIGDERNAEVIVTDDALGVTALRPTDPLAPPGFARFKETVARLNSDIAVAGYSYGGDLGAPTLTFGTLADIRGLAGETTLSRLSVTTLAGDGGGPVLASDGAVLGVLLSGTDKSGRELPQDVAFMANADALDGMLSGANISLTRVGPSAPLPPEDLSVLATDMTVLVSCWN